MPSLVKVISKDGGRVVEFAKIILGEDFLKEISALRKKHSIDCEKAENDNKYFIQLMENSDILKDVALAVKKLKISKSFSDLVHEFLVTNSPHTFNVKDESIAKNSQGITIEFDIENPLICKLRVGPETVFDDFKIAWDEIQKHREKHNIFVKLERRRIQKNFTRDYEVYIKYKEGLSTSQIWNYFYKTYKKELDMGHIKKIVSEFNKISQTTPQKRNKLQSRK